MLSKERLGQLALGLALLAICLAAYAVLRPVRTVSQPEPTCDCESLRTEIEQLKERIAGGSSSTTSTPGVRELAARVEALERSGPQASASARAPDRVRYVRFEVPSPRVTVRQDEHGGIVVTNDDPELEGRIMRIEAVRPDGVRESMNIKVPPAKR